MLTDSIADLTTRIRNSQMRGHHSVKVLDSRLNRSILNVLRNEGFIGDFSKKVIEHETKNKSALNRENNILEVDLKYYSNGRPYILNISRVSTSGRRVYKKSKEIKKVNSGLGISIISTSSGVMSDRDSLRKGVGGEVLIRVS
jgi:small subunit ribosomal protein S8